MGEPLSRVEAILQNILGADNILVPPGSQVEEILQAIYYNTEYEKNPESRVAEILLAIKNQGIYDGPVLSRVEDILVHKLNNIPYTKHKKEDLSRVEQLLLDWLEQGGGEEIIEYTGTFPMTILANGEPLLDYLISGNTVQSGTPTPDSPIMPEGTGDRTGNLAPQLTEWVDGYVSVSGDITPPSKIYKEKSSDYIPVKAGREYTFIVGNEFPGGKSYQWRAIGWYTQDKTFISRVSGIGGVAISTGAPSNAVYCRLTYRTHGETTNPMLNSGSTPLPYEPYGYKIPISSASTTTPVYLGEVETTRKVKKYECTGDENWRFYSDSTGEYGAWQFYVDNVANGLAFSSALSNVADYGVTAVTRSRYPYGVYLVTSGTGIAFQTAGAKDIFPDVAAWKSYLQQQYAAGTPVTIWYVLATEETGIVNEPLMRIGDYADTLSMEQAGEDIPTNEKPTETVIDVPTSVKPSEGYIKYTEPTDGPTPKTKVLGTKNHEIYMTSNNEVYVLRR